MANFIILTLAIILLSTGVNAKKNVYQPDFEYQHDVIERLVKLEESGKDKNGVFDDIKKQLFDFSSTLKDSNETIKLLQDEVNTLRTKGHAGSSTYTRWGRMKCDGDAELVYSGYMAGAYYSHAGSGSNYLCITTEPKWGNHNDATQNIGLLYGVEYIADENDAHDAPCVVCRVPRNSVIMTPGTNECEEGWTLEYWGYLTSQAFNQQAKDFICLDKSPEKLNHGNERIYGGLLYKVEGRCGSLKCPPYKNGRELTCAVCSFGARKE